MQKEAVKETQSTALNYLAAQETEKVAAHNIISTKPSAKLTKMPMPMPS